MTDIEIARVFWGVYREWGYNPLPSSPREKRPLCRFAHLWTTQADAGLFDRLPSTNIQVMTGIHWGLLVVDIDGPKGLESWANVCASEDADSIPQTWIVKTGRGHHMWFTIPRDILPRRYPSVKSHPDYPGVDWLCDGSLVQAPPSIHPSGSKYQFLDFERGPGKGLPSLCPAWLWRIFERISIPPMPLIHNWVRERLEGTRPCDWRMPLNSRPRDVVGLIDRCRIRIAGARRTSGWIPVYAFDREDRKPSAAIHSESGYYVDSGTGQKLSILQLLLACGVASTPEEARQIAYQ